MSDPAAGRAFDSRFDGPQESPGRLLWLVSNRWRAAQREALKPLGLTHARFVVLASLAWFETDEAVTQRRLAEHAALDVMMTSQVLRALEHDALLVRLQHPTDARAKALRTTPAGRALVREAIEVVEQCDAKFFEPLEANTHAFVAALGTLDGDA